MNNTPHWLKKKVVFNENISYTRAVLNRLNVDTVCRASLCPNQTECYAKRFAAFLILGPSCTRHCGFCSVEKNRGREKGVDPREVTRLVEAVKLLGLKHVVITSVTRDDLPDGGASQFAAAVEALKRYSCNITVELLIPDFGGCPKPLKTILKMRPDILGHNIETVRRLYPIVRPASDYDRSIGILALAKEICPGQITKSGIMLGFGEMEEDVIEAMGDLRRAGCDMITIGQYLKPGENNLKVERVIAPDEFAKYRSVGEKMLFKCVASGPFVRSSYLAEECYRTFEKMEDLHNECHAAVLG